MLNLLRSLIAIILIFSSLLLSACISEPGGKENSTVDLTVETEPLHTGKYTDTESDAAASRLLEAFSRAIYAESGAVLNAENKEKLMKMIKNDLLPVIEENISFNDLSKLNIGNTDLSSYHSIANSYLGFMQTIGSDRCGKLFYEFISLFLKLKNDNALEKYNAYHHKWDMENAERYQRQLAELSQISPRDLSAVCSMLALCISALDGADLLGEGLVQNDDAAEILLTFMRRQSTVLKRELSKESTSAIIKLLFELTFFELPPPDGTSTLEAEEWYAISDNGEAAYMLGESFYGFFEFYYDFSHSMTKEDAETMLSSGRENGIISFCSVASNCEESLKAWLDALVKCRFASPKERDAVFSAGHKESFELYAAERKTPSSDDVFALVLQCANKEADVSTLADIAEDIIFVIAPYAAYVISEDSPDR